MLRRIAIAATMMVCTMAGTSAAQLTGNPPPKFGPTQESLPPTGRTIGGPSGMKNLFPSDEAEHALLGFVGGGSNFVNACTTVLSLGAGTVDLIQRGSSSTSSVRVGAGFTKTLCVRDTYSVSVRCLTAPCTFEWRVDYAPVTGD